MAHRALWQSKHTHKQTRAVIESMREVKRQSEKNEVSTEFTQINSLAFHCSITIVRKSGNCRMERIHHANLFVFYTHQTNYKSTMYTRIAGAFSISLALPFSIAGSRKRGSNDDGCEAERRIRVVIRARDKTIWCQHSAHGINKTPVTRAQHKHTHTHTRTSKQTKSARIHFISEHVPMISEHLWVSS